MRSAEVQESRCEACWVDWVCAGGGDWVMPAGVTRLCAGGLWGGACSCRQINAQRYVTRLCAGGGAICGGGDWCRRGVSHLPMRISTFSTKFSAD